MSSSILRALMEAALQLAIESGRAMYNEKRLPYHDHANRSRSLKTSIFTEPLGRSHFYRIQCLSLRYCATPN
ncbi:hypothetical protein NDI47_24320 [Microcoleus vaginatus GB1-A2]|uniref:hypothetical protein n=1 Tax=Microcoleus vaginatus TaxID=119532 RepID=UPI00168442FD|nr:hypothetical protein [Microcoleus sp. FACHB-61]